ncbi:ribonuclease HI [Candidatus Nomurabacteria bacterium RIFOXYB1_FULL_39_16]|uniref:Ribonuclease H n=1 Tax=Candidatus Nomurabacteria bacterium RIFOXYB1_FULL_39_16 TaxID=1801803 RepID=A0A1F6YUI5_9BACT|nr:MAG: ribonuclease HI [Candidatus Nomurabacteria bacterium RIFOXYB1_FULL_39_16]OGJ15501.1 MAG: ribonuclease HI [Candidatus Nomurabacteria bacterium RIFOXYD1_FULL_39_12]
MEKNVIKIYTDGAARGNPGPAGWGVVVINGKEIFEIGGRKDHATNNQMELTAPIEALKYLKNNISHGVNVEIVSDSKYVILGITEWIFNWQKNNWRNAAKKPVMNRELWEELYELVQELKPSWTYVKGHSGDKYNDRVDEIATSFADNDPVELIK